MQHEMRWRLDDLFPGFDSKMFSDSCSDIDKAIEDYDNWADGLKKRKDPVEKILEEYLEKRNSAGLALSRLSDFAELSFSVNTADQEAVKFMELFEKKLSQIEVIDVKFVKWIVKHKSANFLNGSESLKNHSFHLSEMIRKGKYMLDSSKEKIISDMKATGSSAWTNLHNVLTSSLLVDFTENGKIAEQKTLPQVRSMAYSPDPLTRKKAYEAELASYPKIEKSICACINGIKGEVITTSRLRGYKSPLEMTLLRSRMDKKTLDAMMRSLKKYLPVFRKYYRKKALMLRHRNGLPFFDIFAPISNTDMQFSYSEAKDFIVEKFSSFSPDLGLFAKNAFENGWIDAQPREGKVGGAFCANLRSISQSRILSNFSGSYNDVRTLAHELGHAFHGHCLNNESFLNSNYPMPLAETASIFCETIVNHAALKQATTDQQLSILEADISSSGQVIVDIYSRYLFETEVFENRASSSLSVDQLKEIMLSAQKEAYAEGLDPEYLHPYMWLVKPHYYVADYNFYNFPYAFGLLFAKGLYAIYLERGSSFVENYKRLLSETGRKSILDVGKSVGIDLNNTSFWNGSFEVIKEDIGRFLKY
ncbi:MAG TPA: M3 family oligoendopeptidase [bacterium]|nr:M3 family oligoendopeptidase [bacterium]